MKRARFERWMEIASAIAIGSMALYALSFFFPRIAQTLGQFTRFREIAIVSEEAAILGEELLPAVVLL